MGLSKEEVVDYVNKFKKGDKEAFLKLYTDNVNKVYYVCLKFLKNSNDAQDVTQEAFLTAMEKIETLQQAENFGTWLNHIAVNKCKNILLKNNQVFHDDLYGNDYEMVLEETSTEFIPEDYINNKEKREAVMDIIDNKLSDVQRIVILLYYYEGESVANIANFLECSEGTVKSRLSSARKIIKKSIEEKEKKGHSILGVAPYFVLAAIMTKEAEAAVIPETISKAVFNGLNLKSTMKNYMEMNKGATNMVKKNMALKVAGIGAGVVATIGLGVGIVLLATGQSDKDDTTTLYTEEKVTISDEEGINDFTEENTDEEISAIDENVNESEEVLVDNEYCKIIFNGFEIREDGDVRMKLSAQNKTDMAIIVGFADASINGIMMDLIEERDIEPNETIEINTVLAYGISMEKAGIETEDISLIDFVITMWDKEETKRIYEEKHLMYPLGKAEAKKELYELSGTDTVLIDNDICKVVYLNNEVDEHGFYYLNLYIENKTDMDIRFEFASGKVNDTKYTPTHSWPDVNAGTGIYYAPSWCSLEEKGISASDIENIEMQIKGYDRASYGVIMDETVTVNP